MVGFCFKEDGRLQRSQAKETLSEDDSIFQADTYVFVRSDGSRKACTPCEGPHFCFPYGFFMNEVHRDVVRAEEYTDDEAIARLHLKILKRYNRRCLFTGERNGTLNTPFPIVPPPVLDTIKEKLREEWGDGDVFTKSSRFPHELLQQSLKDSASSWLVFGVMEQLMWERGELALWRYPGPKGHIVHTFDRSSLHPKVIARNHLEFVDEGPLQRPSSLIIRNVR